MKDIGKWIARFLFFVLVAVVLVLNASFGLAFVSRLFPDNWVIQFASLFLFDAGAVIWFLCFLFAAEGTGQRAISIIGTVTDLIGAFAIAATEIFTAGENLLADPASAAWLQNTAMYVLIGWVIANAILIYLYHTFEPSTWEAIGNRSRQDRIMAQAAKMTDARVDEISAGVADRMAQVHQAQALLELERVTGIRLLDDGMKDIIDAQYVKAKDEPVLATSLLDKILRRKPKQKIAVYSDAPRHNARLSTPGRYRMRRSYASETRTPPAGEAGGAGDDNAANPADSVAQSAHGVNSVDPTRRRRLSRS